MVGPHVYSQKLCLITAPYTLAMVQFLAQTWRNVKRFIINIFFVGLKYFYNLYYNKSIASNKGYKMLDKFGTYEDAMIAVRMVERYALQHGCTYPQFDIVHINGEFVVTLVKLELPK